MILMARRLEGYFGGNDQVSGEYCGIDFGGFALYFVVFDTF